MKALNPNSIAPPFARYSHGAAAAPGCQLIATSGQLGMTADGTVPEGAEAQAKICFANIDAVLAEAGAGREDVLRLNAYVTDRAHMAGYMAARDAWLANISPPPASTLVIVIGFTRPEFVVEIEATAAVRQTTDAVDPKNGSIEK
ncbi:RidA family protein [Litoreibacter roseus]|uniref:Enamine deaminase RidA n=1 Tax=Litoreibacter roseus TaxID=2601869 RepID=A0A6N6JFP1_9RHOB|nr:RidA family protein [Litoreibacter roseus]GFE65171.1 enamine deaminase RidA [Litoreibacter roseus]